MAARFYVMVGIPGSGKTTYARRYLGYALRVSLDDLRLMLTGQTYVERYEPVVVLAALAMLETLLSRANRWHQDVLLDATNVSKRVRRPYVAMAKKYGLRAIGVYVHCDLETALARDSSRPYGVGNEVVRRFHARLQPPNPGEGFMEIVEVSTDSA